MLRAADRRTIVPIVLAVDPSDDCPNRSGCCPVGRLSQAFWLLTRRTIVPIVLAADGRLSQSFWLFGCFLKTEACSSGLLKKTKDPRAR
jgi:hypothetical protein